MKIRLFVVSLWLPLSTVAQTIEGQVVSIADGDTLTVLSAQTQHKVRLAEIDAPEISHGANKRGQPFGQRSRQSLAELCFQHSAIVRLVAIDRYGRSVGRVTCDGVDANAEQVRRGMAWVYDKYVTDRGLYQLQNEASAKRRGLWGDVQPPVPPWEWRHRQ